MQILIYGATEIGYMIAARLCHQHDITVIEEQEQLPDKFRNLDISLVVGSGADIAALEQADGKKARLFIACSQIDEANIVACWTIKKISDVETVCFVSRAAIHHNLASSAQQHYQTRYDIDTVIWPEHLLTQDIFRIIMVPEAVDVEHFDGGRAKLFEYRIKEDSPLCGVRVMDYTFPENVLIVGITHNSTLAIPGGATTIEMGDKVAFMGTGPALDQLAAQLSRRTDKIRTAAIIGGGNVGYFLAQQMERSGIRVKLIEQGDERCAFLAAHLHKSLVLEGDGTDIELLEEENIGQMDVVVCVTNNDEKNLLCSLLAKQLGNSRIITRAGNERNVELFERAGVDVVVSPRESAMKELLNLIRIRDADILAFVAGGQGEVLLIAVPDRFPDTRVMDLGLPSQAIIGVIKRGKRVIIPHGSTTVSAGDHLTVFTIAEKTNAIQSIFSR